MKSMVNLRALKINSHDPRLSKAFLLLSSELSHLNGALSGATDWKMLEDKCFQLFRDYGYDLQNGVWFCLINMQLKSWAGLAEGLDLLTTAFTHNNVRCWPPVAAVQARQSLIDWFCANVATHIYTLKYGPENNGEMRSVERSIGVLYEYSKNLQSRSHDSLKNLHYFFTGSLPLCPLSGAESGGENALYGECSKAADSKTADSKTGTVARTNIDAGNGAGGTGSTPVTVGAGRNGGGSGIESGGCGRLVHSSNPEFK